MVRNYLRVAWRSLRRHASFSFLNAVGLAIGLACVILIGFWVEDELSYDDFHPQADRTYRVLNRFNMPELQTTISHTPAALARALRDGLPAVEEDIRVLQADGVVSHGRQRYVESDILYADDGFFEVFGFRVLSGTAHLDRPGTVLLTPAMARKYVPSGSPIGATIRHDGRALEVTGVVAAPPSNTHLDYTMIASLATRSIDESNWGLNNFVTYLTLQPGASPETFETQIDEFARERFGSEWASRGADGDLPQYFRLQPITSIHLGLDAPGSVASVGSITYVYVFSALALFVLLLACINFMNLSTARSAQRANEAGVRRALGAGRLQLAGQFLGESLLMTGFALVLALGICTAVLPAFNDFAGKSIAAAALVSGPHLLALMGLGLVVGMVAGMYPAFVLSGYQPVETLRARSASTQGSPRLRQALVVVQFAISIALIAGTAIVHRQVAYMQSKGLGFNEENVVVIDHANRLTGPLQSRADVRRLQQRLESFKQELAQVPGVTAVTSSYSVPGTFFINSMFPLKEPSAEPHNMNYTFVGCDYVETLDIEMAAGRDFSRDYATDTTAVVLNEAAAREYGLSPDEAVGRVVMRGDMPLKVIGVTKDFHYESLHNEIYPLILFHEALRPPQYVAARIERDRTVEALNAVRATWSSFSDLPVEYSFLADDLAAQYRSEQRLESLFTAFAGLAILIACLGLFGLAAYAAQQRTKEIGIRKALGATVSGIVGLLSKDFLKLVGIAFVVAAPAAYLGMRQWLRDFPYRVDLGVTTFVWAGGLAFVIATLTVSYQAWRAARTNPVEVLHYE